MELIVKRYINSPSLLYFLLLLGTCLPHSFLQISFPGITVTVTEALVLHPPPYRVLEDRERITESIRILVHVDRMKQKCIQVTPFCCSLVMSTLVHA